MTTASVNGATNTKDRASELDAVLKPVATANGLPNEHYVDANMFAAERERVFYRNWAALGFGKDVARPGDVKPLDFLGQPLLIVRDRDNQVRVFQNTCRHRGMILVDEPGHLRGAIRCPYHSWCYDLKGRLITTPHVGGPGVNVHENIEREKLGLVEIRSHVWRDVIFINIDGHAPAFEEYAGSLIERWRNFEQPMTHGGEASSFKLEVASNWKLAVENYCESYHLPWVHPGLNSYSRLEDHYHIEEPGHYSGQGTLVYRQFEGEGGARFPDFDGLSHKWDTAGEYVALYPNVLFGVHRDHQYAIIIEPTGPDHSIEHVEIYYTGEGATGQAYDAMRRANAELWRGVFVEDVFVVEGMQRGRHAHKFDGGRFSPVMDSPTHCFHHWVASQMTV